MNSSKLARSITGLLAIATLFAATLCASFKTARAGLPLKIIALRGDPAPDANGAFFNVFGPTLNDSGQVAFVGSLTGTSGGGSDDTGIFLGDSTSLHQIVREGDPAPDANDIFSNVLSDLTLNNAGQIAFRSFLTSGSGIFRADGTSLVQMARNGQPAPDANGTIGGFSDPSLNNVGQVAFSGGLTGTSGGSSDDTGIFLGDGTSLVQVVRAGQSAPDTNGSFETFDTFGIPALNDSGQVAFFGDLTGSSGGNIDNSGIFLGDGTSLVRVAREGDPAPDGNGFLNGTFRIFYDPALNDAGQAAFLASLNTFRDGIFLGDDTSIIQVVREGQLAPDGNGSFSTLGSRLAPTFSDIVLNDAGQAAFVGYLFETSSGLRDDSGIFRGDGTDLVQIVREGQLAPDGNGSFTQIFRRGMNMNNSGQVAFIGTLNDTIGGNTDDRGLFLYTDSHGLVEVARTGDAFLGSTITEIDDNSSIGSRGDERSSLNELGQLAFRFALADGRVGIAVTTPASAGDYDRDGDVDGADFLKWQSTFGSTTDLDADGNGNKIIDAADYTMWRDNYGSAVSTSAVTTQVPEPPSIALTVFGLALIARRLSDPRASRV